MSDLATMAPTFVRQLPNVQAAIQLHLTEGQMAEDPSALEAAAVLYENPKSDLRREIDALMEQRQPRARWTDRGTNVSLPGRGGL